jgi:predicted transport protein
MKEQVSRNNNSFLDEFAREPKGSSSHIARAKIALPTISNTLATENVHYKNKRSIERISTGSNNLNKLQAFVSFLFLKSKLKAYLNIEIDQINDPLKKVRDVKDIGHYSSGKTEIIISDRNEIPYVSSLIKQAYEIS